MGLKFGSLLLSLMLACAQTSPAMGAPPKKGWPEQNQIQSNNEDSSLSQKKEEEGSGQKASDKSQKEEKPADRGPRKRRPTKQAGILPSNSGPKLSEEIQRTASFLDQGSGKDAVAAQSVVGYVSKGAQSYQRVRLPDGKVKEVPYAVRTPYGTRYLDSPSGVERYSRSIAGREVLLEYKDGIPQVTHVLRGKTWAAPSPDDLKTISAFTQRPKQAIVQYIANPDGSRTAFAYQLNADGTGRRTQQYVEVDRGVWLQLPEGKPMRAWMIAKPPHYSADQTLEPTLYPKVGRSWQIPATGESRSSASDAMVRARARVYYQRRLFRYYWSGDYKMDFTDEISGRLANGDYYYHAYSTITKIK